MDAQQRPALAADAPATAGKKKRIRYQRSYCTIRINQNREAIQELQARCQALSDQKLQLESRMSAVTQGIDAADEELLQLLAARMALGRSSQQLQLEARQHAHTLEAIPPPEAWGAAIAQWTGDHLRFMAYDGIKLAYRLLCSDSNQMPAVVSKASQLAWFQISRNADAWLCGFKQRNLLTGELAPPGAYERAMATVDLDAIPTDFLYRLQEGLLRYKAVSSVILQRGMATQRRLRHLLGTTHEQAGCMGSGSSERAGRASGAPMSGSSGSAGGQLPASANSKLQQQRAAAATAISRIARCANSLRTQHSSVDADEFTLLPHCTVEDVWTHESRQTTQQLAPCSALVLGGAPGAPASHTLGFGSSGNSASVDTVAVVEDEDLLCHVDDLLAQVQQTGLRLLQEQCMIYPRDYLVPQTVHSARITVQLVCACLPYQFDVPLVSEALVARALREGRIVEPAFHDL